MKMKLSICIPVYNFDVRELVFDLKKEIESHAVESEIILIDDASKEEFKRVNQVLTEDVSHFIFLEENIGRSRIRNLFLDYSTGEYLLFLDCDGKITHENFLLQYIQCIQQNTETQVVYGGRKVLEDVPGKEYYLRWKFAVERENLPLEQRRKKSYLSFQTNNFVIKKEILQKVLFNPDFRQYGYEDLLFAMDLKYDNIKIDHIDNPILNNDLEKNEIYLHKVEESVGSLSAMIRDKNLRSKLSEVKLVKIYYKLDKMPFKTVFSGLFRIGERYVKKKLLKGNINLRYLDFYKLGLLIRKMKQ